MKWQPIDTAPDGIDNKILVFSPELGPIIVKRLSMDHPDYEGETWYTTWDHSSIWGLITHWAPLPNDPRGAT